MVVGDFNVETSQEDKSEGNAVNIIDASKFTSMISSCGLFDRGSSGSRFTWCNNRLGKTCILERLDRALLNSQWIDTFIPLVIHLNRAL